MEFFHSSDLEYFARVTGKRFTNTNENKELKRIGEILKKHGALSKLSHWEKIIEEEGYTTKISNHWQTSGSIRRYLWGRIYLRGYEESQIHFTIGIGSKKTDENNYDAYLEYKLDCKRTKGLSKYQIETFDEYLKKVHGEYPWEKISPEALKNLDWDKLKIRTLEFIEYLEDDYLSLVNKLWPHGVGALPKIARVCWNNSGWQYPTGPAGKITNTSGAFEKEKGYGYEEWLFDTNKQIDGYHYAFLQAFNKGRHDGKKFDVQLYAIQNNGSNNTYYWVGRIYKVEVLTKEERQKILSVYKNNGWYNQMLDQLKKHGIEEFNFDPIQEGEIFNIKFKVDTDDFEIYDPLVEIKEPKKEIGKNLHYVLLDKSNRSSIDKSIIGEYRFSKGHYPSKTGIVESNYSNRGYQKVLLHESIKEKIFFQLNSKYGGTNIEVGTEVDNGYGKFIDLVVHDPDKGDFFYEIKTGSSVLSCIREALGQLIEYCYFPNQNNASKLIIVSKHEIGSLEKEYLKHLRAQFKIELYYQRYSEENSELIEKYLY